jgi:hypothetical protein
VFDCIGGFLDYAGMVNIRVCLSLRFIEFDTVLVSFEFSATATQRNPETTRNSMLQSENTVLSLKEGSLLILRFYSDIQLKKKFNIRIPTSEGPLYTSQGPEFVVRE